MKIKVLFIVIITITFFIACRKETLTERLEAKFAETFAQVRFACSGITDSLFFSCKFGKDRFCISHNADNYDNYCGLAICARTTQNTLNLSDTNVLCGKFLRMGFNNHIDAFKPEIIISSPVDDRNLSFLEQCEKRLKPGKYPIRSASIKESDGYNILMTFKYEATQTDAIGKTWSEFMLDASKGSQAENAYLEIDNVIKREDRRNYYYMVKGRFNCRLYKQLNSSIASEYINEIKDAVFVNEFIVPK